MINKITIPFCLLSIFLLFRFPGMGQCSTCGFTRSEAKAYIKSLEMIDMVEIPMRDGVILNGRIYFPDREKKDLPTVLIRSPYFLPESDIQWFALQIVHFLKNGYAVVLNNERGRYWSEGEYTFLAGARKDGYDVIDWIVQQPWSNGKVGTYGCSSSAEHQLGLATMDHPAHAAMIPVAAGAGIGEAGPFHPQGMFYRGGVFQMPWVKWYYRYGYNEFPSFEGNLNHQDRIRLSRFYDLSSKKPEVNWEKALRHLPLADQLNQLNGLNSDFNQFITQLPNDEAWHAVEFAGTQDTFGVPALHVNSWYDVSFGPSTMTLFEHMQKLTYDEASSQNQFMIIAPTNHCAQTYATEEYFYGDRYLGNACFEYAELYVQWFDHWLKGEDNKVTDRPKIQLFTMGKNKWEYFDSWPPENVQEQVRYLISGRGANSIFGDGKLINKIPERNQLDTIVYDPSNPVPSLGDNDWGMIPEIKTGSFDQAPVEIRMDVLVFSSESLQKSIQVTGPVEVILFLSSDVRDTDLTAKLVDVYPDGRAFNVAESIQRVRWRNGYEKPVFMEPGEIVEVRIGPLLTSNLFKKGHRIRLELSSSNFPRFERNLNTGGNNYDESKWVIANNVIHYGAGTASRIVLPVVP